jgi:hypothetical protein
MNIVSLQQEIGEWSVETFGHQTIESQIEHIRREVEDELPLAVTKEEKAEELADVVILLCGLGYREGWDHGDIDDVWSPECGSIELLGRDIQSIISEGSGWWREVFACVMLRRCIAMAFNMGIDLDSALTAKMLINRSRKWGKPDAMGVVEHVRDADTFAIISDTCRDILK